MVLRLRSQKIAGRNATPSNAIHIDMRAVTELENFRRDKDEFFGRDHRAPLTSRQQRNFSGLEYFPENLALVVKAKIDRNVKPGVVRMETTKGREQTYSRYGVVQFQVDGDATQVTLYASEGSHELFLPFRDATSGKETYGAGRYLDLHVHGDEILIDFNYAYNPYCAYNPDWSCPLPPAENWLKVPIRAGEKSFPGGQDH
jgi:uncharacterized protein (DUF1684 family)